MLPNPAKKYQILLIIFIFSFLFASCSKKLNNTTEDSLKNNNTQVINKEINIAEENNKYGYVNDNMEPSINKESGSNNRTFTGSNLKYNTKGIPVLMYHSIDYEKGNELRVPKEKFRQQMSLLKEKGYTTLTLNELYGFFINGNPIPEKSVVITFDDGYVDNYYNAYPILKEFHFNAVVFVITNNIDKVKNYLTSDQIIELDNNGVEIESHTVNHEKLSTLGYDKQFETLKNSKEFLENLLNKSIDYIAYPYGDWNKNTLLAVRNANYKMAFSTSGTWSDKSDGIYTLDRVYVSADFDINEFEIRLTNRNYK
ncbi:Poly-beta-1,6-N-acetyl-D-glucosamine N-deacetylase precursor [Clostridium liquoris]|jgi:peptidoglycan/xylan/chitin deacetylase (PgdA/CDA1 family)|uniref:Poly-beta-1,6-N-acetyl-D-glucosamine N-deacetylase n=1 Tax=Clostridium liquoris TaxID=1289519 RepID=A0A2T0BAE3_9CLOT|nr:polysaccharide deacetylase family protein [Clostridium liquoris]PRR80825.1 Poly-beta-1,6-N-acetyl-D-glucosamine N-deacetylase precursor [Clostridium liquoris]